MGQVDYFNVITNDSYSPGGPRASPDDIDLIEVSVRKSLSDLSGTYDLKYPNFGDAINRFTQFDKQEVYIKQIGGSWYNVFTGQINAFDQNKKSTILSVKGRGLSGLLTDKKINDTWEARRPDYILCDPIFGAIPIEFGTYMTTWNAFTDYFDKFDSWDTAYWGSIPGYCSVASSEMTFAGDGGTDRILYGATEYLYEVFECKMKVDGASNSVRFGFGNAGLTEYVRFELNAAGVNSECKTSGTETSNAITNPTQTDYNYYRVEWANSEARFFINGVLEDTITTNVPGGVLTVFIEVDTTANDAIFDYTKDIILTTKIDRYVSKQTVLVDVVRELCEIGTETDEFLFFVDPDFDFNAYIKESVASGSNYGFNSTSYPAYTKVMDIKTNEESKDLYNVVEIRGGEYELLARVDNFIGDGSQEAWALSYKAKKSLTSLTVNAVPQTEGTNFVVTYGKEHAIVTFKAGSIPANGHAIVVTYDYFLPIVGQAENSTSIAELATAEFDGRREFVKTDDTIQTQARADQLADALLNYYSDPRTVIKIAVPLNPTLDIGETVFVDAPKYDITNTKYEIITLEHKIARGTWQTKLVLANAEINTSAEALREILQQIKTLRTKGETTEVIVATHQLPEALELTDTMTYTNEFGCDTFILSSPRENDELGRGTTLDDMETA